MGSASNGERVEEVVGIQVGENGDIIESLEITNGDVTDFGDVLLVDGVHVGAFRATVVDDDGTEHVSEPVVYFQFSQQCECHGEEVSAKYALPLKNLPTLLAAIANVTSRGGMDDEG